jgi:hypothetical protein
VIVRIASEGQYELSESDTDELNKLDNQAVAACDQQDEAQFHAAFTALLDFIRSHGTPVAYDLLAPSEVIIPPPDVSLEEAKAEFSGEGLIPG